MPIDTEAQFTEVYRAHYADVLRFVRRRAHPMNVDDIVGETFLAAWRRRRELPEEPRSWLFGTARKVMLHAQRGMRRHTALAVRVQRAAEAGGHDRAADPAALVDGRTDLAADGRWTAWWPEGDPMGFLNGTVTLTPSSCERKCDGGHIPSCHIGPGAARPRVVTAYDGTRSPPWKRV
ncbi:RNA polymerase sigma factor [Streptomyces sp. NPDC057438]|uniref:RNA polymerase sigma factor n=1 Tax=Streptomyces sp. NPDC057438 TaxID=3346133 RepID=UPI00368C0BE6